MEWVVRRNGKNVSITVDEGMALSSDKETGMFINDYAISGVRVPVSAVGFMDAGLGERRQAIATVYDALAFVGAEILIGPALEDWLEPPMRSSTEVGPDATGV